MSEFYDQVNQEAASYTEREKAAMKRFSLALLRLKSVKKEFDEIKEGK